MYIILLLRIATVSISNKKKSSVTVTMQDIAITVVSMHCRILGESLGCEYAKANASVNYVDSETFRKQDFKHRLLVAR